MGTAIRLRSVSLLLLISHRGKKLPIRVGEEERGDVLIHVRLIVGKLYVGHGLGNSDAFLKGFFGDEGHAGARKGTVADKLDPVDGNVG